MEVFISSKQISPEETVEIEDLSDIYFLWEQKEKLCTFLFYDPDEKIGNYILFLSVNISDGNLKSGKTIASYKIPNFMKDGNKTFYVLILEQEEPLNLSKVITRHGFDVEKFVKDMKLSFLHGIRIEMNENLFFYKVLDSLPFSHRIIKHKNDLNLQEKKYCECIVKVASKQPGACNLEKAWFEERDEQVCYNPFAVCAKQVGVSTKNCYKNYKYEILSLKELESLLNLKGYSSDLSSREELISRLEELSKD